MAYPVVPLAAATWDTFAGLVERNNEIFGGCWCIGYHPECGQQGVDHRAVKQDRVRTDRAHAALVVDQDGLAQGWCQYGNPDELSNIKHKREYDEDPPPLPDWRITCFYVDKKHRGQGIARAALEGALDQIARRGGGLVEAIPEVTTGRQAPGRFLFSATVELFEQYGFTHGRVQRSLWRRTCTGSRGGPGPRRGRARPPSEAAQGQPAPIASQDQSQLALRMSYMILLEYSPLVRVGVGGAEGT